MNFDDRIDRTPSFSARWREYDADVIALSIGDMDFAMPPPIREAIQRRTDHGVLGYDLPPESLTNIIIERLLRLYQWQVESEWIVYIPGVVPGLNQTCRGLTSPGEAILSEAPVYFPFLDAPVCSNRGLTTFDAELHEGRWEFSLDRFRDLAGLDSNRLLLFCNPQNPLGRVSSRQELTDIAKVCLAENVLICSDEIHSEIIFDGGQHIPIASLGEEVANITVTLMSPSKGFGISGLGGAFAVIPNQELRERFVAAGQGIVGHLNAYSLVAMEAAYSECEAWLASLLTYLEKARDDVCTKLDEFKTIGLVKPEATYFAWMDMRDSGLNDPFNALLEAGVALIDGERFGGSGFLRLNFASPWNTNREALRRIGAKLSQ